MSEMEADLYNLQNILTMITVGSIIAAIFIIILSSNSIVNPIIRLTSAFERSNQISDMTFDFNMDHDMDIKPIAKSEEHYQKWVENYPFYANVNRDGVTLYAA